MNEIIFIITFATFVIVAFAVNRMHVRDLVQNDNDMH